MTRTTLDIDRGVLAELRAQARRRGRSMGEVASELLARALREATPPDSATTAFKLPTKAMGEPLVELEDKEAVRRALERRQ